MCHFDILEISFSELSRMILLLEKLLVFQTPKKREEGLALGIDGICDICHATPLSRPTIISSLSSHLGMQHAVSKQLVLQVGSVIISPTQNEYQLTQLLGPLGADRPECEAKSVVAITGTKIGIDAALPPLQAGTFSPQPLPLPPPDDPRLGAMTSLLPSSNRGEGSPLRDILPVMPFSVASPNYRSELMINNLDIQNSVNETMNPYSVGEGKYLHTASKRNWTPLFLKADPQTIGIIAISITAARNAA